MSDRNSEERIRGQWWPAENRRLEVGGTLGGGPSEGYRLELEGAFTQGLGIGDQSPPSITVCGRTSVGPVTLLETLTVTRRVQVVHGNPLSFETLQPVFVVKGTNIGPGEPGFDRARARFSNLDSWWGKRAIQMGPGRDSFAYAAPEPEVVRLADGAVLTIDAAGTTEFSLFEAHMKQLTEVAVTAPEPVSIREFSRRYLRPFKDLMTLAGDSPSAVTSLWMSGPDIPETATRDGFVEVLGQSMYGRAAAGEENLIPIFNAATAVGGTAVLVQRWYELYEALQIPISVLLSLRYARQFVVENTFILVALALESWHLTLMDHPRENEYAFNTRKAAIIDSLPEESRAEVSRALANVLSFKERVAELLVKVQPSVPKLITDVPALARRFRDDRNDIFHHSTGRHRPSGEEMLELARTGVVVLTADILLQLGFSPENVGTMLQRSVSYREAELLASRRQTR